MLEEWKVMKADSPYYDKYELKVREFDYYDFVKRCVPELCVPASGMHHNPGIQNFKTLDSYMRKTVQLFDSKIRNAS